MVADEILVKKTQGGDTAAYGELVRRYQDRVYGLVLKMFSPEDARDVVQEIFIRVFRGLPGFNYQASFATWLYRISTNVCLDQLRRRGREGQRLLPLEMGDDEGGCLRDNSPGPEEHLLDRERVGALKRAVQELPDGYRMALVLHHYQGLSYRQVAEAMGLPEKTVATRIHRAKKMLRKKLSGGEDSALPEGKKGTDQVSGRRMPVL